MSDILPYVAEPNRVQSHGAQRLDAIGLSFVVDADGVQIDTRTGPFSDRSLDIGFDDVRNVELVEEVAFGVEIETLRTTYTVTNVTSSRTEALDVIEAIRHGGSSSSSQQPTADRRSAAGPQPDRGTGSETTVSDTDRSAGSETDPARRRVARTDAGRSTVGPGEVLVCHDCDHKTAVPESLPETRQNATCPDCGAVIGFTPADREYIVVDPGNGH